MNECGECTLCCYLFKVNWLNKPENTACIHCDNGCSIHEEKPTECTDFNCAYIQSGVDNEELRPDKTGVVFEMISDRIFLGTVVLDKQLSDTAINQVYRFLDQGFSVVLYSVSRGNPKFMISKNHIEHEIKQEFIEIQNGHV